MTEPLTTSLTTAIPALRELEDDALRESALRAWAESLARSPYQSLVDVPQSPSMVDRSLLDHVNEVNDLCLHFLESGETQFRLRADRDVTLAAAILHDVDKPLLFRRAGRDFVVADGHDLSEHGALGADLLAECGVLPAVADLVRYHSPFTSEGLPATPEGTILTYADHVANDLACLQWGAAPIHTSMRLVPR